jgi:hypothetical protein
VLRFGQTGLPYELLAFTRFSRGWNWQKSQTSQLTFNELKVKKAGLKNTRLKRTKMTVGQQLALFFTFPSHFSRIFH